MVSQSGPDHNKVFTFRVSINGQPAGEGSGRTKKEAEQIIAVAEQKARALVSDEEIIRNAKERATQMLSESGQRAREIQRASIEFSENTLLKAEQTLTDTLAEVKKVRTAIRAKK